MLGGARLDPSPDAKKPDELPGISLSGAEEGRPPGAEMEDLERRLADADRRQAILSGVKSPLKSTDKQKRRRKGQRERNEGQSGTGDDRRGRGDGERSAAVRGREGRREREQAGVVRAAATAAAAAAAAATTTTTTKAETGKGGEGGGGGRGGEWRRDVGVKFFAEMLTPRLTPEDLQRRIRMTKRMLREVNDHRAAAIAARTRGPSADLAVLTAEQTHCQVEAEMRRIQSAGATVTDLRRKDHRRGGGGGGGGGGEVEEQLETRRERKEPTGNAAGKFHLSPNRGHGSSSLVDDGATMATSELLFRLSSLETVSRRALQAAQVAVQQEELGHAEHGKAAEQALTAQLVVLEKALADAKAVEQKQRRDRYEAAKAIAKPPAEEKKKKTTNVNPCLGSPPPSSGLNLGGQKSSSLPPPSPGPNGTVEVRRSKEPFHAQEGIREDEDEDDAGSGDGGWHPPGGTPLLLHDPVCEDRTQDFGTPTKSPPVQEENTATGFAHASTIDQRERALPPPALSEEERLALKAVAAGAANKLDAAEELFRRAIEAAQANAMSDDDDDDDDDDDATAAAAASTTTTTTTTTVGADEGEEGNDGRSGRRGGSEKRVYALATVLGQWAKFLWQKRGRPEDAGKAFDAAMAALQAAELRSQLRQAGAVLAEESRAVHVAASSDSTAGIGNNGTTAAEHARTAKKSHYEDQMLPPAGLFADFASYCTKVRRDAAKAEEVYLAGLAADPTAPETLGGYARFLANEKGDYARAEELYRQAIDCNASGSAAGGQESWSTGEKTDTETARFRKERPWLPYHDAGGGGVVFGPGIAVAVHNLVNFAQLLKKVERYDECEAMLRRALAIDGGHPQVLNNLANFLWRTKGDVAAAKAVYVQGLQRNPADKLLSRNYAIFLSRNKDMRPVGSAGSRSRPRRRRGSGGSGGGGDGPIAAANNGMPLGGGGGGGGGGEADGLQLAVLEEADDPLLEMGTIEAAQVRRIAAAAALRKKAGEKGDSGASSSGSSGSPLGPMSIAEHKGGTFEDD